MVNNTKLRTRKKRLTFVDNVKDCWKWISMWAMVLAGAIQTTWETMPAEMKAGIPPKLVYVLTIVLLIVGMVGRTIKQK